MSLAMTTGLLSPCCAHALVRLTGLLSTDYLGIRTNANGTPAPIWDLWHSKKYIFPRVCDSLQISCCCCCCCCLCFVVWFFSVVVVVLVFIVVIVLLLFIVSDSSHALSAQIHLLYSLPGSTTIITSATSIMRSIGGVFFRGEPAEDAAKEVTSDGEL